MIELLGDSKILCKLKVSFEGKLQGSYLVSSFFVSGQKRVFVKYYICSQVRWIDRSCDGLIDPNVCS